MSRADSMTEFEMSSFVYELGIKIESLPTLPSSDLREIRRRLLERDERTEDSDSGQMLGLIAAGCWSILKRRKAA